MAQPKKSGINWKLYGGILVVGLIAYFMTSSNPPAVTSAPAAKKKPPVAPGQAQLLPVDFKVTPASFTMVQPIRDTFVPLVYRSEPDKSGGPIIHPSELTIPGNFTGGEANWAFNGSTQVDGKWSALVENGTSGQSEYLHPGQKWKTSTVKDITENVLILRDVSGAEKPIQMQADIQAAIAKQQADLAELKVSATAGTRTVNSPNAPLDPGLVGAIGNTTVQADGTAGQAVQQIGGGGQGNGGGGGRRGGGRGGRGGGRGGGGYGGGGG